MLGDSPSDSLDNSIIGSTFSVFTTRRKVLELGIASASKEGLGVTVVVTYGISTVELSDWRLTNSVDVFIRDKGRPYAL
jgi:hypothetical protein